MLVDLVPRGLGQDYFLALPMGEPLIGTPILFNEPSRPVGAALDSSIKEVVDGNAKMFEQIADLERQLTQQYGEVVKVPSPVARLTEQAPLLLKAVTEGRP